MSEPKPRYIGQIFLENPRYASLYCVRKHNELDERINNGEDGTFFDPFSELGWYVLAFLHIGTTNGYKRIKNLFNHHLP